MAKKLHLEELAFGIVFVIFLLFGPGFFFNHSLSHPFPYAHFASDSFQHQVRAEAIKDAEHFRYEASYISLGIEGVVGRYPPVLYHLSVLLSHISGLETYDTIVFIVLLFGCVGVALMFYIIKRFNSRVALLSLPLCILTFTMPASVGVVFGHWPSFVSQAFMLLFFWLFLFYEVDEFWFFLGIVFSGIVFTHTSEAVFSVIFTALFYAVLFFTKKLSLKQIIKTGIGFVFSAVISSYYLIVFMQTWAGSSPYKFAVDPEWVGNPGFYLPMLGLLLVPLVIGAVFSLSKLKSLPVAFGVSWAMLICGYMNYIGFQLRSFQLRFFWPIYLSVFFGLGLYLVGSLLWSLFSSALSNFFSKQMWFVTFSFSFLVVSMLLIGGVVSVQGIPSYVRQQGFGLVDSSSWDTFSWIARNTPENAQIYFLFGDIYTQDAVLRTTKRRHQQIVPQDYIQAYSENKIKRFYKSEKPGDNGGSLKKWGTFPVMVDPDEVYDPTFGTHIRDICQFDYFVVDRVTSVRELSEYNVAIGEALSENDFINAVHVNDRTFILHNAKPGEDCIEERAMA